MNVVIKSISGESRWGGLTEETQVYVNGEHIGGGRYGGEPEDNMRSRKYAWVETVIERLAHKLGADVLVVGIDEDAEVDEEEDE